MMTMDLIVYGSQSAYQHSGSNNEGTDLLYVEQSEGE